MPMTADEYHRMVRVHLEYSTNVTEKEAVDLAAGLLEMFGEWMKNANVLLQAKDLREYYLTVRIPARTRARGNWMRAGKMSLEKTRLPIGLQLQFLDEHALAEWTGEKNDLGIRKPPSKIGTDEYSGSLDPVELARTEVVVRGGFFQIQETRLHGGYRYVIAPRLRSKPVLFAYPEGNDSWKHSQFLKGGPVYCAGMLYCFKGTLVEFNNGSGHYRPPPQALKAVHDWLARQGVVPTADQLSDKGKTSPAEELFRFMHLEESKKHARFATLHQLRETYRVMNALGSIKKAQAKIAGVAAWALP